VTRGTGDPTLHDQRGTEVSPGLILAADQIDAATVSPGDPVPVTLLWQATKPLPDILGSLRLELPNGPEIQRDDERIGGSFPSDRWPVGGTVREQRLLEVPPSAPPGRAIVELVVSDGPPVFLGSVTIRAVRRDFQPPSLAHPVQASFGDVIGLAGYDLSIDRPRPGGELVVTLVWQSLRTTATSYHVFVHLLDSTEHIWAQWDGEPRNWSYPVTAWVPGEYVVDRYTLSLPTPTPPGSFVLEVGLYDAVSGARATIVPKPGSPTQDRIILQSIDVVAR